MVQVIQHFKMPLLQSPHNSISRAASRLLVEMIKLHRLHQSGLDYNSKFSHVAQI